MSDFRRRFAASAILFSFAAGAACAQERNPVPPYELWWQDQRKSLEQQVEEADNAELRRVLQAIIDGLPVQLATPEIPARAMPNPRETPGTRPNQN